MTVTTKKERGSKKKGMLIVVEGQDGSGKATQIGLLARKLRKEGHAVKFLDFPRYGKPSAALVEEYLKGKFGTVDDVSPKAASIFYAVDRYAASIEFMKSYNKGAILISNRYTISNEAHQGSKLRTAKARQEFWKWNEELEYEIFGIPKPDRVYYLHVPVDVSYELIKKRNLQRQDIRKDIHEENLRYLRQTEKVYEELSKRAKKWTRIECVEDKVLLSREAIHERVWKDVEKRLKK